MPTPNSARRAPATATHSGPGRPLRRSARARELVLVVLLVLVALATVRLGIAGLFVELAQERIDQWAPGTSRPPAVEVERAAGYFSDSLSLAADDPWALEGAGAMDLARMRASTDPREALAAAQEARARFRLALRARPTSPYLWANLALTKLYLDEIDAELLAALRHADELGPWQQTIQQTVVFVGLAAWPHLDSRMRNSLLQTMRRGAVRSPQKILEIGKSYARLDLVCAIQQISSIAAAECSKAAAAAESGAAKRRGIGR